MIINYTTWRDQRIKEGGKGEFLERRRREFPFCEV